VYNSPVQPSTQIGRAILASNLELDAPKHVYLMVYMLVDSKKPNSFFKVRSLLLNQYCFDESCLALL